MAWLDIGTVESLETLGVPVTGAKRGIREYIGHSDDTKPTGVPRGSTCVEYDTLKKYVTYDGDTWVLDPSQPTLDPSTHAVTTIEFGHHQTHQGNHYTAGLTTADLDSNPLRISFTTSATAKEMHMWVKATTSGQAVLTITEAPSGGVTGGTTLTPLNRDRNSANTSLATATHAANVGELTQGAAAPTGGTVFPLENLGSGNNKQSGGSRNEAEWILKRNTQYSIELESATNLIIGTLTLDWYEHTSGAVS